MSEIGLGWNQDTVMRLVDEYRKKPELWDTSHDSYRVQTAKYGAWSQLAAMFECDVADLRRKMNSILASLRREKIKVRCGGHSTWFLYEHLSFLPRHLPNNAVGSSPYKATKKTETEESDQSDHVNDNTEQCDDDDEEYNDVEDEEQELVFIKEEPTVKSYAKSYKYIVRQPINKPRLTRRIRKKPVNNSSTLDSKILETLRLIRRSDFAKKKDACDSFGHYVADSLRKHDERTQCMIKQAINNILFEQEMKKYGHYEVLIATDDNPLILEENSK
ncbi:uncharacterized protein LOC106139605 [Amyelois transitella]|uniref:uncharacterized protein LOC106139605 n=1 Tax=Amyelois transitella TaxID=680683 RepID=UPI00067BBA4C|nr:uncharacterized protein LOC106139605 [Amyelois transitella]